RGLHRPTLHDETRAGTGARPYGARDAPRTGGVGANLWSPQPRTTIHEVHPEMYSLPKNVYRERKDFSKIKTTVPIPNLIEIQRKSYERFLQMNRLPSER